MENITNNFNTLTNENVIQVLSLDILQDLEVNGNAGAALQVLSKDATNHLIWQNPSSHDDAGYGLSYDPTRDELDLNLGSLQANFTVAQSDYLVFNSVSESKDVRILNSDYIDNTLTGFATTSTSIGATTQDDANNYMWIQQLAANGSRTLHKVLINTFVTFCNNKALNTILSAPLTFANTIQFGNTVLITPTLDAHNFIVEDNVGNVAFAYTAGPTRKVNIGNFVHDSDIRGNKVVAGTDTFIVTDKLGIGGLTNRVISYERFAQPPLGNNKLRFSNDSTTFQVLSNLDGDSNTGSAVLLDIVNSIFKINHLHDGGGGVVSANSELLLINSGSQPYFKIFTDGGLHDLVVIDVHNRVSNFNLEYKPPSLAPDTSLKSRDFFKINHKNDEDNSNYGQIEMLFTIFNLGTQTIDTGGGFKFDNNMKKIQFLNMFNQPGLEYLATSDLLRFNAPIDESIIPNITGTYDLGSASKEWNVLYCNSVVGANVLSNPLAASFLPTTTGTFDLGATGKIWNNLHIHKLITNFVGGDLIPFNNDDITLGSLSKVYTEIYGKTIAATANVAGLGGTLKSENLVVGRIGVNTDLFVSDRIILDTTTGLTKILPETNDVIELGSVDEKFKSVHSKLIDSDTTEGKAFNFKNTAGTNCMYWDGSTGTFTGVNSTGAKSFEWDFTNQEFNFYHTRSGGPFNGQRQVAVKIRTNTTSNNSPMQFNNLPTGSTGLNSGDVWVDTTGGYLKLA